MTEVYDDPWPVLVENAYGSVPSILKWTHSIIHEWNFKSEWQAREDARGLAFEMAQDGILASLSVFPSPTVPVKRRTSRKSVTFAPNLDDKENCAVSAVNVPGLVQCKPNPAERAQVPDPGGPPPHDQDRPERHAHEQTFLDRPYWQQQVWQRLQEEGDDADPAEDGPVLFMNSYFICHATHRRQEQGRPLRFDTNIDTWERDMRFVWEDLVSPVLPLSVHLVTPEPPFSVRPGTAGTLLLVQSPHPFLSACLITTVEPALPRMHITEVAQSFDIIVPFRHILFHAGVGARCDERQAQRIGDCEVRVGRRILPQGQPVRLHEGMGLIVDVPPPMSQPDWEQQVLAQIPQLTPNAWPDDTEETSFLAHSVRPPPEHIPIMDNSDIVQDPNDSPPQHDSDSSSSNVSSPSSSMTDCPETWQDTLVLTLHGQPVLLQLPWHDRHVMLQQLQNALDSDNDRLVSIHHVSTMPEDIQQIAHECLLVEMSSSPSCSPIMRLILVDNEVYPPGEHQPVVFSRKPIWMPQIANRLTVFRLLGIEDHYQANPLRGHLWLNHIWISHDDAMPLQFLHGDFLAAVIQDAQTSHSTHDEEDVASLFQGGRHSDVSLPGCIHQCSRTSAASAHHVPHAASTSTTSTLASSTSDNNWLLPVGMSLMQHAQAIDDEGHAEVEWITWHMCPYVRLRSDDARPIRFDIEQHAWLQDLQHLWRDQWIPHLAARILVVDPFPPKASYEHHVGHLLIVQGDLPQHVPVLITTVFESALGRRLSHQACFLSQHFEPVQLFQIMRLEAICQMRSCRIALAGHDVPLQGIGHAAAGDDVKVHVTPSATAGASLVQTAAVHSKQVSHHPDTLAASSTSPEVCHDALEMPWISSTDERFVFNPAAPAFEPGRIHLAGQSEFIQDLYSQWYQNAFAWEGEVPSCVILTWMVDHTWEQPPGFLPRPVRLHDDYAAWEDHIRQAWRDLLHPDAPYEISLVFPKPPTHDNMVIAHVVLIQHPREDWVTSVVTCFDNSVTPQAVHQAAITTHEHILFENLLRVLNYFHACSGTSPTHWCEAWYHDLPLRIGAPIPGHHGYGIVIHVHRRGHRGHDDRTDVLNLLQLQSTVQKRSSWERLTTDAVAQAQWPQDRSTSPKPDGDTLLLQELIPAPTYINIDFTQVIHMRTKLLLLDLGPVQPRASVVKWHLSTQEALQCISDWQGDTPSGLSFFTDGSAACLQDDRRASAAVVCIVHTVHGDQFGGYRCFDTSSNGYAPHAEAAAILTSVLWAIQLCETSTSSSTWSIQFNFDCMFAGMTAQGHWFAKTHEQMQHTTRALVQWMEARYAVQTQWVHVPAHQGHPWNEAADAAAWAAVSAWIPQTDFQVLTQSFFAEQPVVAWLWLLDKAEQGHPAFPSIQQGVMKVNASAALHPAPQADDHPYVTKPERCQLPLETVSFELTCATANVLTLYQNRAEHGRGLTARLEALIRAFDHEGVMVIGVQETRSQMQGHTMCLDYHVLAAPATANGRLRVESFRSPMPIYALFMPALSPWWSSLRMMSFG